MSETLSSGLTLIIPSEGDNNWATSIKSNCFQKISEHDHTGSGKGVQIGTNALANLAVTEGKIANGAISTAKLGTLSISASQIDSNAVTTSKIADGNVTEAKLADDAASRSALIVTGLTGTIANGTLAIQEIQETIRRLPKTCKITHLSISNSFNENISSGTLTITLYKNRVTTGQSLALTAGEARDYAAISVQTYAPGDTISYAITQASVVTPLTAVNILVDIWGHFTE